VLFVLIVFVLPWLEIYCFTYQERRSHPTVENFWIQVLLGRWLPISSPYSSDSILFSVAVVIAAVLNIGFYTSLAAGLLGLWRRVLRIQMEVTMRRIDELRVRDRSIKNNIIAALLRSEGLTEEQRRRWEDRLDNAFEDGHKMWMDQHLPTLLGEQGAERERKRLYKQVS
jgi:hypothetical protein